MYYFVGDTDQEKKEYQIFIEFYDKLVNVINVSNIKPYLVSEKIINPEEDAEIHRPNDLLLRISGPLKSGLPRAFYTFLKVLSTHGNDASKELAHLISQQLQQSGKLHT